MILSSKGITCSIPCHSVRHDAADWIGLTETTGSFDVGYFAVLVPVYISFVKRNTCHQVENTYPGQLLSKYSIKQHGIKSKWPSAKMFQTGSAVTIKALRNSKEIDAPTRPVSLTKDGLAFPSTRCLKRGHSANVNSQNKKPRSSLPITCQVWGLTARLLRALHLFPSTLEGA